MGFYFYYQYFKSIPDARGQQNILPFPRIVTFGALWTEVERSPEGRQAGLQ